MVPVEFLVYDPNDPYVPGLISFDRAERAVRGHASLRHDPGRHPRVQDVLLAAAVADGHERLQRAEAERIAIAAAGVATPIGQDVEAFWSSLLTGASGISQIERFPVADLRVGRGGEIKKLDADQVVGPDPREPRHAGCSSRPPTSWSRSRASARFRSSRRGWPWWSAPRSAASRKGRRRWPAIAEPAAAPGCALRRARARPGAVARRHRARHHRVHRLRLGRDRARGGRRPAPAGRGRRGGGRRVRHPLPLRDARLRRAPLAHARRRPALRPAPQRAAPGGGARPSCCSCASRTPAARRLGTLLGYGSASDALAHRRARSDRARARARRSGPRSPRRTWRRPTIDFVSAHGTGTPKNDPVETMALERALGPRARGIPVNSIKPGHGPHHGRGGHARSDHVPARVAPRPDSGRPFTWRSRIRECELDHVLGRARVSRPRISLSTSLGFGGCNAALVLEGAA